MSIIEGILTNGVTEILKKLVLVVDQEISLAWGVKDDLRRLQETLETILDVVADAEGRQVNDAAVARWLKRLKDVAYDADDVLDEFSYETIRRHERGNRLKHKLLDFVSSSSNPLAFIFRMARKIRNINQRLDEITKDMQRFHFQAAAVNYMVHGESSEQRSRQTASFVNDSEIVGREDDKIQIVDMLTKSIASSASDVKYQSSEKVPVISVVGMGGLGKTTLAQLVYKDEYVNKYFDKKIWVCVSTDFDVEKVLVKIMESITLAKFDNVSNFDLLVTKVQENLQGKKFLLVLDDLWNQNAQQWERLKTPLDVGARESKILITTRNMQVADVVKGSIRPHQLGKLPEDECWSIMEKRAFYPGGAEKTPGMTKIGKEIAKKCGGLPLAAKFLGSLMHSKNKESDWLSIRQIDVWTTPEGQSEIRPILKLSYDNLSPHLKQCFSYCSIFPKGWEIQRETLIYLWMAEGFLGRSSSTSGNERMIEDIGEEYFDSLVWSSFFDGVGKNELHEIISCKMHDLVHDLARDVFGGHECAAVKVSELESITSDIRRVQLIPDVDLSASSSKAMSKVKNLRTIIVLEPNSNTKDYTFSSNKKSRVLHFGRMAEGCPDISAHKLRHLRYFCLPNGIMHNDNSISKLFNLQTLVLSECGAVKNLLENMGSLNNLRFLDISKTNIKELPDSVTSLCNLRRLNLSHCKSLTTFPTSVTGWKYLRVLDMSFTTIEELPGFIINLQNLNTLDVSRCVKLKSLPEYVAGLANLRIFNLRCCLLLKELPKDFGSLTELRSIDLARTKIRVLPGSSSSLHNLEYVNLWQCELPNNEVTNWIKVRTFYQGDNMEAPNGIGKLLRLQELIYQVRERVINEPERNNGIEELGNLNFLEWLRIGNLQNVKDPIDAERANLKGKQNLRALELNWGEIKDGSLGMTRWHQASCNFKVFEALQPPTGLRSLKIENFMGCDLPTWMCIPSGTLLNLNTLEFACCKGIAQLPSVIRQLPLLHTLILRRMSLKSLDIGGFSSLIELKLDDNFLLEDLGSSSPPCLQDLYISGCKSLTEIPSFPSLTRLYIYGIIDRRLLFSVGRSLTSLTKLYLVHIEELIYFPISILQNNCNLQLLIFQECYQFQGFRAVDADENGKKVALVAPDLYSCSLQDLEFIDCEVLKFLPDLRGWTSLRKLLIWNSPEVKESLTYDLKSLSFLKYLYVDFIQRDEQRGDLSTYDELINLMQK